MSGELSEVLSSLNDILQTLADSKDGQEIKIPAKINLLIESMFKAENLVNKHHSGSLIPISVIEKLDKSSSSAPIEDMLKNDFQETEKINLDLKTIQNRFHELSDKFFN